MTGRYVLADVATNGLFFLGGGCNHLCLDVIVDRSSPLRLLSRGRCCISAQDRT